MLAGAIVAVYMNKNLSSSGPILRQPAFDLQLLLKVLFIVLLVCKLRARNC